LLPEEYHAKLNSFLTLAGFKASITKEEEVFFLNNSYMRSPVSKDSKIHVISNEQLTGYENEKREIYAGFCIVTNLFSEFIDAGYLKLVGGPKEWDLVYEFVISFIDIQNQTTFKRVTFSVPVGVVCSIGADSSKLLGLIQKMFCAKHDNSYGPNTSKANDSCYIKKELKTQLIAELMEELEKEIE
jgi:hypothetical protein